MDTIERNSDIDVSRRHFLVGTATAGAGLAFGYLVMPEVLGDPLKAFAAGNFTPAVWYTIEPSGLVTVHVNKSESGQHIGTAFAQFVAEELEADWNDMRLDYPDPAPQYQPMFTAGSLSVAFSSRNMLIAGAAGRIALIEAGAKALGVSPAHCHASKGWVIGSNGKRVSYAELVATGKVSKVFTPDELKKIPLKKPTDYKVVGTSLPALDIPAKTNGTAKFGIDSYVDGMVYAKIARPPVRYGATPISIDDSEAKKVPGYIRYVSVADPTKTAVHNVIAIAENYPAAMAAARALKINWDLGPNKDVSSASILQHAKELTADPKAGHPYWVVGDVEKAMPQAATKMDAEFVTSLTAHAQMEPMNCTAYEKDGMMHVRVGTQYQVFDVPRIAEVTGLKPDKIAEHQAYLGGAFGRRFEPDAIVPAVQTAQVLGRPVKLLYDRQEETRFDFHRTITYQRISAGLDGKGNILAIDHDICCGLTGLREDPRSMIESPDKKGKVDPTSLDGSDAWYSIPNYRVRSIENDMAQAATPPGYLRSIGAGWTIWARESFIDEIAHKLGKDPVALRLSILKRVAKGPNAGAIPFSIGGTSRLLPVIHKAVQLSDYRNKKGKLGKGRGIGMAIAEHLRFAPTWSASVIEVSVNETSGEIKVDKITIVADVGTVVNPRNAEAQLEGAALMGVSFGLYEQATMSGGGIEQSNFDSYTPMRMSQVPDVVAHVMGSGHTPTGIGEPGVTTMAPAIGNAVFDAIGVRLRELPMTPERVLAGLKKV
jgi:isoquinoline 1-oxidoreductase subunit beta